MDEAYKQKLSATVRSTLLDDFAYPQYLTDTFDSWLDNFLRTQLKNKFKNSLVQILG